MAGSRSSHLCGGLFGVAILIFMAGWLTVPAHAQVEVERVSFTPQSSGQGYVVRLHTSDHVPVYGMPRLNGADVEWTIHNARLAANFQLDDVRGPVASVRPDEQNGHLTLRFALDPDEGIAADAYRDGASNDLLMALNYDGAAAGSVRPEGAANSPGTYSSGDRWRLDTIVIDPGHGGRDPGTSGYGFREKDVALDLALRVGQYVEENLGINVVYTRTDDRFVSLRERGRIANEAGGKLFVSIHANAAGNHAAHGTETYFLGMHRSESARRVMERENSVIQLEENPEQYDDLSEQMLITQALAHSAYLRQSELLAGFIEDQFENRVSRRSRGVKQAGFQVLYEASMPAVLVEVGFLSNRNEAAFIGSEQGQTYIASALYRAIRDFKEQYDRSLRISGN